MTTFDQALRQRLIALDAACPEPVPYLRSQAPRPLARSRRALTVFAAAMLLAGLAAAAVVAGSQIQDEAAAEIARQARERIENERRIHAALRPLFPDQECASLDEALERTRQALDTAGFGAWQIGWDNDLLAGGCATYRLRLDNSPDSVDITQRSLPGDPRPIFVGGDGG